MKLTNIFFIYSLVALLFLSSCSKKENDSPNEPYPIFEKTYGGNMDDYAKDILIKNDEIYVFGTSKSLGEVNGDHYLLRLDLNGNIIDEKTYGGNAEEEGNQIISSSDGNFILVGTTQSSGAGQKDIHVIKIDVNGTQIWENTFGGSLNDIPNDIIELSNGELCITGSTESFGNGQRDIYIVWIDQNGNLLRQVTHGESDIDGGTEIIELTNQELMIYGFTRNYGAVDRDLYLLKTNAIGDSLWSQRYGGNGYEESQSFKKTANGGFLLCGHSSSIDPNHHLFGVKTDTNGTVIWENHYGGSAHDGGEALLINSDGNYVFIARTMSFGAGKRDTYMVTTNPHGQVIATKTFGGLEDDKIEEIIQYRDYYYLVGQSNSYSIGDNDVYLIKHHK